MMKQETMFYIALGTVVDDIAAMDAFKEYASTEDNKKTYPKDATRFPLYFFFLESRE